MRCSIIFKVHFCRVPVGDDSKKKFEDYVSNLEKTNPTYAFFADLRDFVQHCGLPVGHLQRTETRVGKVTLTVTTEASWLVENWQLAAAVETIQLTKDSGCFDLISMMKDLRQLLIEDFGKFTASIYGPPLLKPTISSPRSTSMPKRPREMAPRWFLSNHLKANPGKKVRYIFISKPLSSRETFSTLAGAQPGVRIVPFRGEYYELRPERRSLVRSLIYPVPDPSSYLQK